MKIFVYGTLLVPRIWTAVTARPDPRAEPARLKGHAIYRVEGGDFPAIIESEQADDEVPGRLIHDLDVSTMRRLDAYEDRFYERVAVDVETERGETVVADAYRVPPDLAEEILSSQRWTLSWFRAVAEDRYWNRLFG